MLVYTSECECGGKATVFEYNAVAWDIFGVGVAMKGVPNYAAGAGVARQRCDHAIRHDAAFWY